MRHKLVGVAAAILIAGAVPGRDTAPPAAAADAKVEAKEERLQPWEPVDPAFNGCSEGVCGRRGRSPQAVAQPGAKLGQYVYCPVSGAVFQVKESSRTAGLDGKPLYLCCEACARYFAENRDRVLALRGLEAHGPSGSSTGGPETKMATLRVAAAVALPPAADPAGETAKATLSIKGMTCGGCVAAVKVQLKKTEGVTAYDVSLEKGEAEVTYDPAKTEPKRIGESVSRTGFEARPKDEKER